MRTAQMGLISGLMCLELALSGAILNFPRTLLYKCDPLFGVLIGLFFCAPA